MSTETAKKLAHELTIKYIKTNPGYLSDVKDKIPDMVNDIADINQRFYDAIVSNDTLNKLN